ncbi:MAG TPA: diacylglycerol kinase family protein [Myxococcaceae bacterium]|nr:diacylglycerol kinase family protein [Myxococcaceae bacterium]
MTAPAPVPLRKPPYPPRRGEGFWASALHAWNGLVHTVVHQPNMKVHVVSAILVGLVGSGLPLGLAEKVTLIFCVLLVFFAEILNSALETLVDLATQEFDEKARVTKDAAAAAVLVLSIGSAVIFAALLVHNWSTVLASGPRIERQVLFGVPLAACAGLLMRDRPRPWIQDALAFIAGLGLCAILAAWTTSVVFTAMTAGLLVLALAAARERARARATKNPAAT